MKNFNPIRYSFILFSSFLIAACADSHKQEANRFTPPSIDSSDINKAAIIHPVTEGGDIFQHQVDMDAMTRANSLEPIIYGVGAAGITFETLQPDALKILPKPKAQSQDNTRFIFPSGIFVQFRKDDPKVPIVMRVLSDYQGVLKVPGGEIEALELNKSYAKYFLETDPEQMGESFVRRLYRVFEKASEDYDCLAKNTCGINRSKEMIVLYWGSKNGEMGLVFSIDSRKALSMINMLKGSENGNLDSDFDILRGKFLVSTENVDSAENFGIGETWESIYQKLNSNLPEGANEINQYTNVGDDSFSKSFSGIGLGFSKSEENFLIDGADFDQVENAVRKEMLSSVGLFSGFSKDLMFNGKIIQVNENGDNVQLSAVDPSSLMRDPKTGAILLDKSKGERLGFSVKVRNLKEFSSKLDALIRKELEAGISSPIILASSSRWNQNSNLREFYSKIAVYDSGAKKGKIIDYVLSEKDREIQYFGVEEFSQPLDKVIIPGLARSVDVSEKNLAGFALGSEIKIGDIDIGRRRATVVYNGIKQRASYSPDANLGTYFNNEDLPIRTVVVGTFKVKLGMAFKNEEKDQDGFITGKIVSVSSNDIANGITGACGDSSFKLTPLIKDTDLEEMLRKVTEADKVCNIEKRNDSIENSRLGTVIFHNENLAVSISGRESDSITIYTDPREVK